MKVKLNLFNYTLKKYSHKKSPLKRGFKIYACPVGPKLSGIGACSVSLISP
ncbi:hypothetical protein FLCH110379_13250 [Flavobacterium chungbukense]